MATKKRGGLSQFTVKRETAAVEPAEAEGQGASSPTPAAPAEKPKPETVRTTIGLNRDALKALKHLAADEGVPVNTLLVEGVNRVFRDRGRPEIA